MERNIITTIEFKNYQVAINAIEQLDNNRIEIFNSKDQISNINLFIKNSFNKINYIIKGQVKDVFIVIEPSKNNSSEIKLVSNKIVINDHYVCQKDINDLIAAIKKKYEHNEQKIILVHPIQFMVEGTTKRIYRYAPIGSEGNYISVKAMMTSIKSKTYMLIKSITKLHSLNIKQFFITPQTISNCYLSKNVIYNGSILINFENKQIIIIYNKNGATITYFNLYDWGLERLIINIVQNFNCSNEEAYNLILVYGSLKTPNDKKIIYTKYEGIKEINYSNLKLYDIIKNYFLQIVIIIKEYIKKQNLNNILLVISGKNPIYI